jgi:hypothetical protein
MEKKMIRMNIWGQLIICLLYSLQSQHMAHNIPINVWAIPIHAYIISTIYLHQRGYYYQWHSEGTNQQDIWVEEIKGDKIRGHWKHKRTKMEMGIVVSEPPLSQIFQIGRFCVLVS